MASKTGPNEPHQAQAKPAGKPMPRKRATKASAPAADTPAADDNTGARALIRAGLKALGDVRGDMVARQAKVFELLLGIGQSPLWNAKARKAEAAQAPDPFGKFEAVFDQRVARSLERVGMPSPQQLKELSDQVEVLTAQVRKLQPKTRRR